MKKFFQFCAVASVALMFACGNASTNTTAADSTATKADSVETCCQADSTACAADSVACCKTDSTASCEKKCEK